MHRGARLRGDFSAGSDPTSGAEGREWYETWRQTDFSDGRCERSAYKWGRLAHDEYPDPGHAREWHEKWGEEWRM